MNYKKYAIIAVLVAGLGTWILYTTKNPSESVLDMANKTLPEGIKARVTIQTGRVLVNNNKIIDIKTMPRANSIVIDIPSQEGSPIVVKDPPMISLCALPMIGIETGTRLQPRLGLQVVRSDPLDMGLSIGISPDTLDVSLDKDIRNILPMLSNSVLGLGFGLDRAGYSRFLLHFSVFL